MMKIYHNPKCSKSRQAKVLLDETGVEYQTRLYLNDTLSIYELNALLVKLDLSILDVIRTKESLWKENFKDTTYTNDELIQIVADNPGLLERPIIEYKDGAVVSRTEDKITHILSI